MAVSASCSSADSTATKHTACIQSTVQQEGPAQQKMQNADWEQTETRPTCQAESIRPQQHLQRQQAWCKAKESISVMSLHHERLNEQTLNRRLQAEVRRPEACMAACQKE